MESSSDSPRVVLIPVFSICEGWMTVVLFIIGYDDPAWLGGPPWLERTDGERECLPVAVFVGASEIVVTSILSAWYCFHP